MGNLTPTYKGPKPFGWEVEVEFMPSSRKPVQAFRFRGCTERQARERAYGKKDADRIVAVRPMTQEEWARFFGLGG